MPEVSVVVVAYRTPDLLRTCLEHLTADRTRRETEILVVDNDSGDETPEVARSFPGVRLVESGENLGFAGGVNRGFAAATGRYVMILNPDVETRPGALDRLADFLDAHPGTGIAAPKLLNTDGSLQYSCRRKYTLTTILLRRTFLGSWFPKASALRRHLMLDYDHAEPRPVDWVAGAAMMVRRAAIEDVGVMEERYFLYFEDLDFCARMQARGWLVQYVPDAVMTHHWQRASLGLGSTARRHLRSGLRFYDRWGGLVYVLRQYHRFWRTLGLMGGDILAFLLAGLTAYLVRQQLAFLSDKPMWPLSFYSGFLTATVLVNLAAFFQQGLYREIKEGDWVDVAFRVARGATLAALVLMASTFILKMQGYSRVIVFGAWPLVMIFAFLARRIAHGLFDRARRDRWNLRRIALVGEDPVLRRLEGLLRERPELGWDPVWIRRAPGDDREGVRGIEMMIHQLTAERVSEVVVTPDSLGVTEDALVSTVFPLRRAGFGVRLVSSFLATLPPRSRIDSVRGLAWVSLERPGLRPSGVSKRILDLGLAVPLIVLGLLPLALWALGRGVTGRRIREPESPRRGRWGEPLGLGTLSGGGPLRGYPGLFRVLCGHMSLVGPRPVLLEEPVPGGVDWQRVRDQYRPGLIGPWTLVSTRSSQEEMQQELRYLDEWSPERDLKLLARVLLRGRGSGSDHGSASPVPPGRPKVEASASDPIERAPSTGA